MLGVRLFIAVGCGNSCFVFQLCEKHGLRVRILKNTHLRIDLSYSDAVA